MFYSQQVLTKKGPLAKIWLAAHMQSKLTKAMVFATDVRKAVDSIISPDAPMALRLTSNLLLGVVRILHRKTKYLLQESSDALTKLKLTFRPASATSVDLPATTPAQNFAAVTLADASVDDLAAPMVDLSLVPSRPTRPSASSAFLAADRDITIDEFAGGLAGGMLDAFALEPELDRDEAGTGLDLADLDADANEPLLFTPSQRPSQSQLQTPKTPSVRSAPSSVEVMRAEGSQEGQAEDEAPVLSIEREVGETPATPEQTRQAEGQVPPISPIPLPSPGDEEQPLDMVMPVTPPAEGAARPDVGGDVAMTDAPADGPPVDASDNAMILGDVGTLGEEEGGDNDAAKAARISTGSDELALAENPDEDETEAEGGEQARASEGEGNKEVESAVEAEEVRKRGRKRKRVLIEDAATEMSVRDFRACLNDTSDLLRQPRRGGDRTRRRLGERYHGRRGLEPFAEFLSRPSITLAPQLNELFAMSFRMDDYTEQVGSPISDADLVKKGEADPSAKDKDETEKGNEEESPQKLKESSMPDETPRIGVEDSPAGLKSAEKGVVPPEEEVEEEVRPTKEVTSDPHPTSPLPVDGEERRNASETNAVPIPEDQEMFEEQIQAFDLSKISLKDVASTRSQVENDEASGEGADVTESTISARTRKMQEYILQHLDDEGELNYSEALSLEPGMTRRTAARSFYELLNLSSKKALQLSQQGAYGTIRARPLQPVFDSLAQTS